MCLIVCVFMVNVSLVCNVWCAMCVCLCVCLCLLLCASACLSVCLVGYPHARFWAYADPARGSNPPLSHFPGSNPPLSPFPPTKGTQLLQEKCRETMTRCGQCAMSGAASCLAPQQPRAVTRKLGGGRGQHRHQGLRTSRTGDCCVEGFALLCYGNLSSKVE